MRNLGLTEGQQVFLPLENPVKANGHLQMLYGNLAAEGSVAKISGKDILCQKTRKILNIFNWQIDEFLHRAFLV